MALLFMEGFDTFGNSQAAAILKGWSSFDTGQNVVAGRFGGNAAQNGGSDFIAQMGSSYSTIFSGFAHFWNGSIGANSDFFLFVDTSNNKILSLQVNGSGKLVVQNSSGSTIATGTTPLAGSTWYYIEVKCVIAGASGSVTVQLNGVSEIAATTGNFGSTNVGGIRFKRTGVNTYLDDVYVLDTTGSTNNAFLGEVRVKTILPNGAGAHTQWTPSAGANYTTVADASNPYPDGDTTYVGDGTPGDIDTYTYGDIDGAATVHGVQVSMYARKDDASVRQIAPVIRQAATDYVGTTVTLGSSYAYYKQIYDQDPTAAAWTAGNVNADEYGIKEIA